MLIPPCLFVCLWIVGSQYTFPFSLNLSSSLFLSVFHRSLSPSLSSIPNPLLSLSLVFLLRTLFSCSVSFFWQQFSAAHFNKNEKARSQIRRKRNSDGEEKNERKREEKVGRRERKIVNVGEKEEESLTLFMMCPWCMFDPHPHPHWIHLSQCWPRRRSTEWPRCFTGCNRQIWLHWHKRSHPDSSCQNHNQRSERGEQAMGYGNMRDWGSDVIDSSPINVLTLPPSIFRPFLPLFFTLNAHRTCSRGERSRRSSSSSIFMTREWKESIQEQRRRSSSITYSHYGEINNWQDSGCRWRIQDTCVQSVHNDNMLNWTLAMLPMLHVTFVQPPCVFHLFVVVFWRQWRPLWWRFLQPTWSSGPV